MIATRHDIPINPKLPKNFDCTDNRSRPHAHMKWWGRPYIVSYSWDDTIGRVAGGCLNATIEERRARSMGIEREAWFAAWPSGTRYDVRCLDGGAWDRSTNRGSFATLEEAVEVATNLREPGF